MLVRFSPSLSFGTDGVVTAQALRRGMELVHIASSDGVFGSNIEACTEALCRSDWLESVGTMHADLLYHWAATELDELQWPALAVAAKLDRQRIEALAQASSVPTDEYMRANDLVRCHGLRCSDPTEDSYSGVWFIPATAKFARSAPRGAYLKVADPGELVLIGDGSSTISSGWRNNDELLLNEGWADAELQCDEVELSEVRMRQAADCLFGASPSVQAQHASIIHGLRSFGYLPSGDEQRSGCSVLAGGLASDYLGRYLQALSVTETELGMFGEAGCTINIGEGVPLSCDHEQRVGQLLHEVCTQTLAQFATSIEADETLLEDLMRSEHQPSRFQFAVRSRLSRKRALAACSCRAVAWVERPTATASLRRPWRVNIKTSG